MHVQEAAEMVTAEVLALFEDSLADNAWHGALLALAELARKQLLQLASLKTVLPLVSAALNLDIRRGSHRYHQTAGHQRLLQRHKSTCTSA